MIKLITDNCCLEAVLGDPDPHVFGPPGSGTGSISHRGYESGSGSISGSFPFLIKVLSVLRDSLQNYI
jgi:hypothetical protein